jgi:hypothetical protein
MDGDEKPAAGGGAKPLDLRWTKKRREVFLQVLAQTYNPDKACEQAGLTWFQMCELRVRHPDFAIRFDEVIAAGYDRLETKLLREAGVGSGAKVDPALAQALLKQRRAGKADAGAGARKGAAPQSREQLIQSIMDKLAPLKAARAREMRRDGGFAYKAQPVEAGAVGREPGRA